MVLLYSVYQTPDESFWIWKKSANTSKLSPIPFTTFPNLLTPAEQNNVTAFILSRPFMHLPTSLKFYPHAKGKRLTSLDEWCHTFQAQTSQSQLSLGDTQGSGHPQLVPHQWPGTTEARGPGTPKRKRKTMDTMPHICNDVTLKAGFVSKTKATHFANRRYLPLSRGRNSFT